MASNDVDRVLGLTDVRLANGIETHETAHGRGQSITRSADLMRKIALDLVRDGSPLRRDGLRFLRGVLGLTQGEFGTLVGAKEQAIFRWERGHSRIPGPADRAVRLLALGHFGQARDGLKILDRIADGSAPPRPRRSVYRLGSGGWSRIPSAKAASARAA